MALGNFSKMCGALALLVLVPSPLGAQAVRVRVTGLTDVAFGEIVSASDLIRAQDVCIRSDAPGQRYSVTATGSGAGGAFTLASATAAMAYEVQWAGSPGLASGNNLVSGVAVGGFVGSIFNNCNGKRPELASLITILRAASHSSVPAGTYTGTLTLLIAPN